MTQLYCRPATHPDLIGISRFPDSTCENPKCSIFKNCLLYFLFKGGGGGGTVVKMSSTPQRFPPCRQFLIIITDYMYN